VSLQNRRPALCGIALRFLPTDQPNTILQSMNRSIRRLRVVQGNRDLHVNPVERNGPARGLAEVVDHPFQRTDDRHRAVHLAQPRGRDHELFHTFELKQVHGSPSQDVFGLLPRFSERGDIARPASNTRGQARSDQPIPTGQLHVSRPTQLGQCGVVPAGP
jgi:hypothetical protein